MGPSPVSPCRMSPPRFWTVSSPNGIQSIEPIAVTFPDEFPAVAPRFALRDDFDRSHPHLLPVRDGPPEPCLLNGSTAELMRSRGILGLVDQVALWLERAAQVKLIDPNQGWESTRRDRFDDVIVADSELLRGTVGRTAGCEARWSCFHTFSAVSGGSHAHRVIVDDRRAAISSSLVALLNTPPRQISLALIAWSGKTPSGDPFVADVYRPENVFDLQSLLKRASELGCCEPLTAKLDLLSLRLRGSRFPTVLPLGIILIARRPYNLIGQSSPLELCPYVIELRGSDDLSPKGNPPVRVAAQLDRLSTKLLRRASGTEEAGPSAKWTLFGCGSVGSKLAIHLARAGAGPAQVVDSKSMSPHNFARHALLPSSTTDAATLSPKAVLLQEALAGLGQTAATEIADIALHSSREGTSKLAPPTADLIVNATGSLTVREALCRQELARPRAVETCLFGVGRIGYLSVEGPSSNPNMSDLVTEAYRLIANDAEMKTIAFSTPPSEVAIGDGCSSLTFPMTDARLSALTAPMAERLGRIVDRSDTPAGGEILLGVTPNDGLGQRWIRHHVPPFQEVSVGRHRIRISAFVHKCIGEEVASRPGSETGGVIIGRWSDVTDTFHVVDLIRAPPDSVFSAREFTLGVDGLSNSRGRIIESTGGALYALGTWHNHLIDSPASGLDRRTAGLLALDQFFPALLLIRLPDGYTALVAESLYEPVGSSG